MKLLLATLKLLTCVWLFVCAQFTWAVEGKFLPLDEKILMIIGQDLKFREWVHVEWPFPNTGWHYTIYQHILILPD